MNTNYSKFTFLFALLFFSLSACTQNATGDGATGDAPPAEVKNIGVAAFKTLMQESNKVILDVRTAEEVAAGKIDGAIHIDYYSADFDEKIAQLDKNQEYLVYCKSGGRSSKSAKKMLKAGFNKVNNLKGGYTAWSAQ